LIYYQFYVYVDIYHIEGTNLKAEENVGL